MTLYSRHNRAEHRASADDSVHRAQGLVAAITLDDRAMDTLLVNVTRSIASFHNVCTNLRVLPLYMPPSVRCESRVDEWQRANWKVRYGVQVAS